jgi:hypothetical protein
MNATTATEPKQRKATSTLVGQRKRTLCLDHVREFARALFGEADMHAKRIESLANGVAGAIKAAMFTIHGIGQAYGAMAHIEASRSTRQPRPNEDHQRHDHYREDYLGRPGADHLGRPGADHLGRPHPDRIGRPVTHRNAP